MPGNAAMCEPIDLQSECLSMIAATFYEHSVLKILHLILDRKFLDHSMQALKRQLPSSNVSLARVIKKFTIMSHSSHTGFHSYTSQLVVVRKSASSYRRSAVAQRLKSSLITRKYTYFRKNRVQIRKSRCFF